MKLRFFLPLGALFLAGSAAAQTLDSIDRGWYDDDFHDRFNDNYFTGDCSCGPSGLNNFFVFDLSSITENIVGATLCLENPVNGFSSPTGSETVEFFDFGGDIASLTAGTGGLAAFDDLGSGVSYATRAVTVADNGTLVNIPLNASAIQDLNDARGGLFALGGTVTTLDGTANNDEYVFGFTGGSTVTKIIIETGGAECFLVVGDGTGFADFDPGMHTWTTQVGNVRDVYLVALDDLPEFVLPKRNQRLGAFRIPSPTDAGATSWISDFEFTVQIVMWNPEVFPNQPEQYTHGMHVRIRPDGSVQTVNYGSGTGMTIWSETDVNSSGEEIVRFPFHIPGF